MSNLPVNARMNSTLKISRFLIILGVIPVLAGCPKRQTTLRLVYAPPPPEAPAPAPSSAKQTGAIVIEAPPPPQPAAAQPKKVEAPTTVEVPEAQPQHHEAVHDAKADANSAPTPPATSAAAPPLEPPTSTEEQVALEARVLGLKQDLRRRITQLSHLSLSGDDRKALQDARQFLSQTDQAMKQGDLQQSLNLAQKADLLIQAVEKRH